MMDRTYLTYFDFYLDTEGEKRMTGNMEFTLHGPLSPSKLVSLRAIIQKRLEDGGVPVKSVVIANLVQLEDEPAPEAGDIVDVASEPTEQDSDG
jgi:hypothetical protein